MNRSLPIAVDLDGTLVNTDLLYESLFRLLKINPLYAVMVPLWLLRGRTHLKQQIAQRVDVDPVALPYNHELLGYLRAQRQQGRELFLATDSHRRYAEAISEHLALFDAVIATEERNMKADSKAAVLVEKFGEGAFCYAGNKEADLPVWRLAGASIVITGDPKLAAQADNLAPTEWAQATTRPGVAVYLRACRLHQWVKNLLIFVPLFTAQQFFDTALVMQSIAAFFAFGFCASSVYVLNDLLDLDADRAHPSKRLRPFAAGLLPISHGIVLVPVLFAMAVLLANILPVAFMLTLLMYYVATTAYSLVLKRRAIVDVLVLAGLYTCRIVAGGTATGVPISEWLLVFSMFIFLSLAVVKRYTELVGLRDRGAAAAAPGRGYAVGDIGLLAALGGASGYISVLVFALYLSSEVVQSMYGNTIVLWGVCPLLLYWVSRVWIIAHRGQMNDDPILFAIRDKASRVVGVLVLAIFLLAAI